MNAQPDPRWLLRSALERFPSQRALADLLEVTQQSISVWLSGPTRPEPHMREAIELVTGVSARAWLTAEELALIERVRQRVAPAKRRRSTTSTHRVASVKADRPKPTGTEE